MKVSALLINLALINATLFTQFAHAECASVGMMGGCLPSEGMVDVPNHMKSQAAKLKQANETTQNKANTASANKKTSNQLKVAGSTPIVK